MKTRNVVAAVLVAASVVLAGVVVADYLGLAGGDGPAPGTDRGEAPADVAADTTSATATGTDRGTTTGAERQDGRARVAIYDENGTRLGVVSAHVADTPSERYTGLSPFESLENGSGMLFVYDDEGERTYVMRKMDFPLDMVFVGADGHITTIHEAPLPPPEADDLEGYSGRAQWVLEVPRNWTDARNVTAGDRIEVAYPANASLTPTPEG